MVGLLSVAFISFQLSLMQTFSIIQGYHFAYMTISIALLGLGASGALLALGRNYLLKRLEAVLFLLMLASSLAIAGALAISQIDFFRFDIYLFFLESGQIWKLVFTYLILFTPFFLMSLALGLIFMKFPRQAGLLYFANMVGAGTGGLVTLGLLNLFFPQQLPGLISLFPLLAAWLILPGRQKIRLFVPLVFCFLAALFFFLKAPRLHFSEFKNISYALRLPGAKIIWEGSSLYGLVQAVTAPALRYAPGVSLHYEKTLPGQTIIFHNGNFFGPVTGLTPLKGKNLLDYTTLVLPYVMVKRPEVLILNARTGSEISQALAHGARRIVSCEPQKTIIAVLKNRFSITAGPLWQNPRVIVSHLEPRTFLALDNSRYDLITLPIIDAFGGSSGIFALQEQYLLTKEAFSLMWQKLSPEGVICVSSWMDYPVKNPLKILATLVEVMEELGISEPRRHLAAVRSWATITFTAKKSPLKLDEIQKIKQSSEFLLFDPALLPGLKPEEQSHYHALSDQQFFKYLEILLSPDRHRFYINYGFNIQPASDNRPYFSQFLRWQNLGQLARLFGQKTAPFMELGYLMVWVTFFQLTLASLVLIILPLFLLGWQGRGRLWTLLYFSGLGLGYIFVEVFLIQKFILYFGNLVISAALVISAMLLSSGLGSLVSSRFPAKNQTLFKAAGVVVILISTYVIILAPVLQMTIAFPGIFKIFLAFFFIALPAFVMGWPFPLGLRLLAEHSESQLPWAWGINGCFSVIGTVLAAIMAVEFGFTVVLMMAAIAYSLAAFLNFYGLR